MWKEIRIRTINDVSERSGATDEERTTTRHDIDDPDLYLECYPSWIMICCDHVYGILT